MQMLNRCYSFGNYLLLFEVTMSMLHNIGTFASRGKSMLWKLKTEARMNHIAELLMVQNPSETDKKAILGLLQKDSYDSTKFTESHLQFKKVHNNAFAALALYCAGNESSKSPVFYLDGLEKSTTLVLRDYGFQEHNLFTANIFSDTAASLRDEGIYQTYVGRAEDILGLEDLIKIPFVAYYLDGCGGSSTPLISMITSIFCNSKDRQLSCKFAIGITLTESDPSGRSLADREQDVTRALSRLCHENGYQMDYVGDNPERYNLLESPPKKHEGTQTTWLMMTKRGFADI